MVFYFQDPPPGRPLGLLEASWVPQLGPQQTPFLHDLTLWFSGPPPWREKAVPLDFLMVAVAESKMDDFDQFRADLLVITLLFRLRSFEYGKTNSHLSTTQFRFQDIQFHDANGVIPPHAAADVFLAALAITLFIDTQYNCVCRKFSTMEAIDLLHGDPVPACACRYLYLWINNAPPQSSNLCLLFFCGCCPKIRDGFKYRGGHAVHK